MIGTVEGWIRHFVDMHTQMPGSPSPDDLRKYPHVFAQMLKDHDELHLRFYTGHEHEKVAGMSVIVPGRTK